jgi:hypothetical protein
LILQPDLIAGRTGPLLILLLVHSVLTVHTYHVLGINDVKGPKGNHVTKIDFRLLDTKLCSFYRCVLFPLQWCWASYTHPAVRSRSSTDQQLQELRQSQLLLKTHMLERKLEYEGEVLESQGGNCVVSFPGKYEEGWNGAVHKGNFKETSVACVFLPSGSERFGQHSVDHDDTQARCYCFAIYGDQKPWGCMWFELWCKNVQRAVQLEKTLQVYFFEGQAGAGKIAWGQCPAQSLLRDQVMATWPKDVHGFSGKVSAEEEAAFWAEIPLTPEQKHAISGLGGSQKAEVAWLDQQGYSYEELDIAEFLKDNLISTWIAEGEYHYGQLIPPRWQHHRGMHELMDTAEGLLMSEFVKGHAEASVFIKQLLETVLSQLTQQVGPQLPRDCTRALSVFSTFDPGSTSAEFKEATAKLQRALLPNEITVVLNPLTAEAPTDPQAPVLAVQHQPATSKLTGSTFAVSTVLSIVNSTVWDSKIGMMPSNASTDDAGRGVVEFMLSHAAADSSSSKVWLLLQYIFINEFAPSILAAATVFALTILPVGFLVHDELAVVPAWSFTLTIACVGASAASIWPWLCWNFPRLAPFGPWRWFLSPDPAIWLDAMCAKASTADDPHGILGVIRALECSQNMIVFFSCNYLTRLWPVFELATYCKRNEGSLDDKLIFLGLDWPSFISPAAAEAVGLSDSESKRLARFSCRQAECWNPNARSVLLRTIREDWGSESAFDLFVRGRLPGIVLQGKQHFVAAPAAAASRVLGLIVSE